MDIPGLLGQLLDHATGGMISAAAFAADRLWALLNSNFSAALAGAGAGAYAAQWIAERNDRKKKVLEEARVTNASINIAFELVNLFCNLKSQHVTKMVSQYLQERARAEADFEAHRNGTKTANEVLEFAADFQTLTLPPTSEAILSQMLFEKVSVTGRPLIAFATLTRTIHGLSEALQTRASVALECRALAGADHAAVAALYFGFANPNGQTDKRYFDTMRAIESYTDDCIFFSKVLLEDLVRHGKKVVSSLGKAAPLVHEPDFAKAIERGLIPNEEQYKDWLSGFKKPEPAVGRLVDRVAEMLGSSG